jgi:hypothetical protein
MALPTIINLAPATPKILKASWRVWLWEIHPYPYLLQMVFLATPARELGKGFKLFCITRQ